jgi:hypothetical protein
LSPRVDPSSELSFYRHSSNTACDKIEASNESKKLERSYNILEAYKGALPSPHHLSEQTCIFLRYVTSATATCRGILRDELSAKELQHRK